MADSLCLGRNHCDFSSLKKEVRSQDLRIILKSWAKLSGRVARYLSLNLNERLVWILSNGNPHSQKGFSHCWAEIQWWQDGKMVAAAHAFHISPHQVEPANIDGYSQLIAQTLITRKEKAAATA